jgi:hypothetical protein
VTTRRFNSGLVGKKSQKLDSHITCGWVDSRRWNTVDPQRPVPTMMIGFEI